MTLPTGPSQFAGAKYIQGIHSTEIQPFIGYLLIRDRFYLHGFPRCRSLPRLAM